MSHTFQIEAPQSKPETFSLFAYAFRLAYGFRPFFLVAGVYAMRFGHWGAMKLLHRPILRALHIGYLWLSLALVFKGSGSRMDWPYHLYLHAFALGAVLLRLPAGSLNLRFMYGATLPYSPARLWMGNPNNKEPI